MSAIRALTLIVCLVLLSSAVLNAGPLQNRHQLGLKAGMWNQVTDARTELFGTSVITTVGSNGMAFGLNYGYWFSEGLALNFSLSSMFAKIENSISSLGVSNETAYINSVLVGAKWHIPGTHGAAVRPFVKAMVGPYIATQTETELSWAVANESRTETVFGGQSAVGADFIIGPHVLTGVSAGYNFMPDFKESIGGSLNYSGPEFTVEISYLFGKIKE